MPDPPYLDRADAGRSLASALERYRRAPDTVVVALGVEGLLVAERVSRRLELPLDIRLAASLWGRGPGRRPQIGVLTEAGTLRVLRCVRSSQLPRRGLRAAASRARSYLYRVRLELHGGAEPASLAGQTVLLVGDGTPSGPVLAAVIGDLKAAGVRRVVFAEPVASLAAVARVRGAADETVVLRVVEDPADVSWSYVFFPRVRVRRAAELLLTSRRPKAAFAGAPA